MAKFGNLPEVVKYIEFGQEHLAFPIGSRALEHHIGANDEPLLSLVFVKQVVLDECLNCHFPERAHGKPFPAEARHVPCASFRAPQPVAAVDPKDYANIVHDIAHDSHEFSPEALRALQKQGITISQAYPGNVLPGGRWRELTSTELANYAEAAARRESVERARAETAKEAADKLKAEADAAAKAAEAARPAPLDDITREAMVRNKQEELRAKPAEAPQAPEAPKIPEPPTGEGTGSVN